MVGVQSTNIKSAKFYSLYETITLSISYSMWTMDMLHYFKLNDTAIHSVVPSLSGKDIHQVNTTMKRSMEKSGTEKKYSGSTTTTPQKKEHR